MAITPDIVDVISSIKDRLYKLEIATYSYGDPSKDNRADLNITGLGATVAYYLDGAGNQRAEVTFSWTAPATPDADNLEADPVTDYMFSWTRSTDVTTGMFTSTRNAITVKVTNLAVGINITGRVYALSKNGINGAIASYTVAITKDTTAPPQPSTPALTAKPGGILGAYDGKDSVGGAMPSDFAYCQVQTSTTAAIGPFTTVDVVSANGTFFVLANANYDVTYVRLLSVDKDGNVNTGVPSTVVSATPLKMAATDLGVVLPGDIGYNDINNIIVDGSFENLLFRTTRLASVAKIGTWSWNSTAGQSDHGSWCLRMAGDATTTKYFYLHDNSASQLKEFSVTPLTKLYCRIRARGLSANGTAILAMRFRDASNGLSYVTAFNKAGAYTGSYETWDGVIQVPSGAVTASLYVQTTSCTTGTIDFDSAQVLSVMSTALIEDAAITRAKIANLAVGDAQIETLDAGKITTGVLDANRIAARSINTDMLAVGAVTQTIIDPSYGDEINLANNASITDKATVTSVTNIQTSVTNLGTDVGTLKNAIVIDSNGINISKPGNPFQIVMDNDSLDFKDGSTVVAQISAQKLYIRSAEILQQLTVGVHIIEKYDADNTFVRWAG